MARKRKPRKEIPHNLDTLTPIDVLSFGSKDDPCFGKLHDLAADECKECGDSDFCAIMKAQNLHKVRLQEENKQRFKDIEEADQDMLDKKKKAKDLVSTYKDKGFKRLKTIMIISRDLTLTKDIVKKVYDEN